MATINNAGTAAVFFDVAAAADESDNLIAAQVDPSQPQVKGLSRVSNPLITDRHTSVRLNNFDPTLYDLSPTSNLIKVFTALISGAGVGGLRRQQIMARMSSMLSGTNFIELDGFWGALFNLNRTPDEALPLNDEGLPLDASTDIADSATWDVAGARDGRYRSRIEQLARGFAQGATYTGVIKAARAVLNCDVEIVESWTYADVATPGTESFTANTWLATSLQYGTWGNLDRINWGVLEAGQVLPTDSPIGNRGEVVLIPGRSITDAEKLQLHQVLDKLLPAGTMLTVAAVPFMAEVEVSVRSVHADSEYWDVTSLVQQQSSIQTGAVDLYPSGSEVESARPAFSQYSGERWSYNSRVANVASYAMDATGNKLPQIDYQTITFSDGTTHDYVPTEALVDSQQLAQSRATSEGVMTSFPYATGRV